MTEPSDLDVPPPKDWQKFERWTRDLFQEEWKSEAAPNGRLGQPQHGVDIYGRPNGGTHWHGVQCKRVGRWAGKSITADSLCEEIEKAKEFSPSISHFILATTGSRDATIQGVARKVTERHRHIGLFSVQVLFWDDILDMYDRHPHVYNQHYGQFLPPVDFDDMVKRLGDLLSAQRTPVPNRLRSPAVWRVPNISRVHDAIVLRLALRTSRQPYLMVSCDFLLDTGAGISVISREVASQLGLPSTGQAIVLDVMGNLTYAFTADVLVEVADGFEALPCCYPASEGMKLRNNILGMGGLLKKYTLSVSADAVEFKRLS